MHAFSRARAKQKQSMIGLFWLNVHHMWAEPSSPPSWLLQLKPRAAVADKTCVLSCCSLPLSMLVTHTRAGRVQVGGVRGWAFSSWRGPCHLRKPICHRSQAMQDLNGSRFISGESLPHTCWGPVCTIEHWHSQDNSRLNDVIKCKVTPGDMIKDRRRAVHKNGGVTLMELRGHFCSGVL